MKRILVSLIFSIVATVSVMVTGCEYSSTMGDSYNNAASDTETPNRTVSITGNSAIITDANVWVCNGIPKATGWGEPLVYKLASGTLGKRTLSTSGGLPIVCVYTATGGVAFYNAQTYFEPFSVNITANGTNSYKVAASGGTSMGSIQLSAGQDYFDALRQFALLMKGKGIAVQAAPAWSFDPIWETYGFEENWSREKIRALIPAMQKLGIKTITFDSGWFGTGTTDWSGMEGDYPINTQVGGSEQTLKDFIAELHGKGFKVRAWWSPLNVSKDANLFKTNPSWYYTEEIPSWDASPQGDWNLNSSLEAVRTWNKGIVSRFVNYGFDGFKQDDVYQIALKSGETNPTNIYQTYAQCFTDIWTTARSIKSDFSINTCNCGVAQNFYDFPGQDQLITSDPVSYADIRARGKVLQAFNVNGAAILGDHIELGKNPDVTATQLKKASWYNDVDLASEVALGMVLETKFLVDPGANYKTWFDIYTVNKIYQMEWVNVPFYGTYPERYIRKNSTVMIQSYFMKNNSTSFNGNITIDNLTSGKSYTVKNMKTNTVLKTFTATANSYSLAVNFTGSLILEIK